MEDSSPEFNTYIGTCTGLLKGIKCLWLFPLFAIYTML